ncbi:MAG: hypothetical protein QXN70_02390 [Nitrososphaerota archaeon]
MWGGSWPKRLVKFILPFEFVLSIISRLRPTLRYINVGGDIIWSR